jgi:DNA-binding NarL/FixJ family response regulator
VLNGRALLPPQPDPLGPGNPLTDRETEILRLLASGLSNREIAHALDLADGTVKNHVSNLLGKLGVRDRTRAVLKGLEQGWF